MINMRLMVTAVACSLSTHVASPAGLPAQLGPSNPPRVKYTIECTIAPEAEGLRGQLKAEFRNTTSHPIELLTITWPAHAQRRSILIGNSPAEVIAGPSQGMPGNRLLVRLPVAVKPDESASLSTNFTVPVRGTGEQHFLDAWHPEIDWGGPVHSDFDVAIQCEKPWAFVCSGTPDSQDGRYRSSDIRNFGIVLMKNAKAIDAEISRVVRIRALHTTKGEACARKLVDAAVEVIGFYRGYFGFYPQPFLYIVPMLEAPVGGCPVATGIVAVHGQERMSEKPDLHWRWITAHEIGHQYWMEHVLSTPEDKWLMLCLGLYADREYVLLQGLGLEKHRELMSVYLDGVRNDLDTRMNLTMDQIRRVGFDYNNVVEHGKSYSFISALSCVVGRQAFGDAYMRCLRECKGRVLDRVALRRACEDASGLHLGSFFEQWLETSRYLSYQIVSQTSVTTGPPRVSEVRVKRLGTLRMPLPVEAEFADGSRQRQFTHELPDESVLRFVSDAPLTNAVLDPDHELAMTSAAPKARLDLWKLISELPYTGSADDAAQLMQRAKDPLDARSWYKLGLTLYDGYRYEESLEAFTLAVGAARKQQDSWTSLYLVWQGHLLDLSGRREDALKSYREALALDKGQTMEHSQYNMKIDRQCIEQRLQSPFMRD